MLEDLQASHRYLAAALLKRSIFDLTAQGRASTAAWHWFFADESTGGFGWQVDDATRVLELSLPHLRRALRRAGYDRPPRARHNGQRGKVVGIIPCRKCGTAVPSNDIRIQRACPACGGLLAARYLRRHGYLPPPPARITPRAKATAALHQLLRHGPLPAAYVMQQMQRAGYALSTIMRARWECVRAERVGFGRTGQWQLSLRIPPKIVTPDSAPTGDTPESPAIDPLSSSAANTTQVACM